MNFKSRYFIQPLWNSNFTHIILFLQFFIVIHFSKLSSSQECVTMSDCKCKFSNGSIIDLTSLGYRNAPRWKDVHPLKNETFTYSYNPCFKFSLGGANSACKDVAVCQRNGKEEYDCGTFARFTWNPLNKTNYLSYRSANAERATNVTLICSHTAWEPQLDVEGEVSLRQYQMTLTSRCACADLCRENHLSTGSVLVIIFMIFISLYLILGIIHSSLTRGAHGWELIPHYEFWVDFPLLVRDGCVFVVSGCKAETAYERI